MFALVSSGCPKSVYRPQSSNCPGLKRSLAYGTSLRRSASFCSRHSARYAVRVKSRCFLLEREADLYTLYNLHCLHTILSPRKVSRSGRLFVSHAMAHLHGSGDLHIPEVEVLIKSLIKKKEKRKEKKKKNIINQTNKKQSGTPRCALKKAASPYGKREFTVSTVMVLTVSW